MNENFYHVSIFCVALVLYFGFQFVVHISRSDHVLMGKVSVSILIHYLGIIIKLPAEEPLCSATSLSPLYLALRLVQC